MLPNFTVAFYFRIRGLLHIFNYKTLRGHTTRLHGGRRLRILWGFCPFIDYQTARVNHPDDGCIFPRRKPIVFNYIIHLLHSGIHCELDHSFSIIHKFRDGFWTFFPTTRLYGGTLQNNTAAGFEFWGFCPFFDYQTARGNHPVDGCFFDNIFMPLLHSCIHCDLEHFCSILHKSRDLHIAYGGRWRHNYQTARWHITKQHGGNHPDDGS